MTGNSSSTFFDLMHRSKKVVPRLGTSVLEPTVWSTKSNFRNIVLPKTGKGKMAPLNGKKKGKTTLQKQFSTRSHDDDDGDDLKTFFLLLAFSQIRRLACPAKTNSCASWTQHGWATN